MLLDMNIITESKKNKNIESIIIPEFCFYNNNKLLDNNPTDNYFITTDYIFFKISLLRQVNSDDFLISESSQSDNNKKIFDIILEDNNLPIYSINGLLL